MMFRRIMRPRSSSTLFPSCMRKHSIEFSSSNPYTRKNTHISWNSRTDKQRKSVRPGQKFVLFPPALDDQTDVESEHERHGDAFALRPKVLAYFFKYPVGMMIELVGGLRLNIFVSYTYIDYDKSIIVTHQPQPIIFKN